METNVRTVVEPTYSMINEIDATCKILANQVAGIKNDAKYSTAMIGALDKRLDNYKEEAEAKYTTISNRDELIRIHYISDEIPEIKLKESGDWVDLYASEDVIIPVNQQKMVPLGISMCLPCGYEAYIVPRSSTFKNYGIIMTNHHGIVDSSYCGTNDQWMFSAYCLSPKEDGLYIDESDSWLFGFLADRPWGQWILRHFCRSKYNAHRYSMVHKGDRICQFRIQEHMPAVKFMKVSELSEIDRGGFGSTGVR
jgi:dUTP pyrophosphatase